MGQAVLRPADVGAYLRVNVTGKIRAGDEITVLEQTSGAPSIREAFIAEYGNTRNHLPISLESLHSPG